MLRDAAFMTMVCTVLLFYITLSFTVGKQGTRNNNYVTQLLVTIAEKYMAEKSHMFLAKKRMRGSA